MDTQAIGYNNFNIALRNLAILLYTYNKEKGTTSRFVIKPSELDLKEIPSSMLNYYIHHAIIQDRLLDYLRMSKSDYKKEEEKINAEFSRLSEECPSDKRESLQVQKKFTLDNLKFDSYLCRRCWLINEVCICSQAKPIHPSQFQHRLIIYMHYIEYARSSNTGALPQVCMSSENIKVLVKGIPSDDCEMEKICLEPNTFVFFPSEHAITFPELIEMTSVHHNPAESLSSSESLHTQRFNIIIVDGTWSQAKKVERDLDIRLPRIKLISIDELPVELRAPMRDQSGPERICTLGAIIQLLKEMRCNPSVIESLSELLMHKTSAIKKLGS
jgi:DTW domain-containing protein YfiP